MLSASVSLSLLLAALPPSSCSLSAAYVGSSPSAAPLSRQPPVEPPLSLAAPLWFPAQAESVMVVHHEPVEGMDVQEFPQKRGTPIIKCGRLNTAPKVFFSFRRNIKPDAADLATQVREHERFPEILAQFRAAAEPPRDPSAATGLFDNVTAEIVDGEAIELGVRERHPPKEAYSPSKDWTATDLNRHNVATGSRRELATTTRQRCTRPDCVATRCKLEESERENQQLRAQLEAQTLQCAAPPPPRLPPAPPASPRPVVAPVTNPGLVRAGCARRRPRRPPSLTSLSAGRRRCCSRPC